VSDYHTVLKETTMLQLTKQLPKNIFSSWGSYFVRIAISFFFVPYITSMLGDSRYGVWVIVFQTINYFTLLDLGLEKALVRFVSKHLSQSNFERINRTLNTAFSMYIILGTIIIACVWVTATFLFGYFKIDDPALLEEGRTALIIIGFYMGIRFYLLPFAGSLVGFQRADIAAGMFVLENTLSVIIMVALLSNGYGLIALAVSVVFTSLFRQVVSIFYLRRMQPQIRFSPGLTDKETARELFNYSRTTIGITLAWLVIFNTDTVLLGLISSSALAGVYAPGGQLMLYLRSLIHAVATPLTPAFSHFEASGDMDAIRRLYLRGLKYTSYLSFFVAIGIIIYARPFVSLWLEPEFHEAAEVMRLLAVSAAFFLPQIIGNAVLFGTDNHRYLFRVLLLEAAIKIVLALLLVKPYGLIGMAAAAAIPQFLLYVTLYPILLARVLKISPIWIVLTSLQTGLTSMIIASPVALLVRMWIVPMNWGSFAINIGLVCLAGLVGGYFILEPPDRKRIKQWLRLDS